VGSPSAIVFKSSEWLDLPRVGDFDWIPGYWFAICVDTVRDITPPEICDAIRNAATTAGTLINLRN
jgi:hypothetical protein